MLELIIALIILGAVLYCVKLLPIDATIKQIITVIVIVAVVIYLLQFLFGLSGGIGNVHWLSR